MVARWFHEEQILRLSFLRNDVVTCVAVLVPLDGGPMFAYAEVGSPEVAAACERVTALSPSLSNIVGEILALAEDHAETPCGSDATTIRGLEIVRRLAHQPEERAGCDCLLTLLYASLQNTRRTELCVPPPLLWTPRGALATRRRINGSLLESELSHTSHLVDEMPKLLESAPSPEQVRLLQWLLMRCPLTRVASSTVGNTRIHAFSLQGQGQCPRFVDLASRFGVEKKVWHGTAPDNAWSILNSGLRNMSGTRDAKHGAVFGNGIYLARSKEVALHFARSSAHGQRRLWRGSALDAHQDGGGGKATWTVLFECEVVRGSRLPPVSSRAGGSSSSAAVGSDTAAARGDYFLVTDDARVRIVGLELWVDSCEPGALMARLRAFASAFGMRRWLFYILVGVLGRLIHLRWTGKI